MFPIRYVYAIREVCLRSGLFRCRQVWFPNSGMFPIRGDVLPMRFDCQ